METIKFGQGIGAQLRKIREEKQFTLTWVAEQLRLSKDLINTIESDAYHLIPTAYLKGYLRAYAKLLALSEYEINQTITVTYAAQDMRSYWHQYFSYKQISASNKFIQGITYSIIFISVILVTMWWHSDNILNATLIGNEVKPNQMVYTIAASRPISNHD